MFWGAPRTGKSRKAHEMFPDAYRAADNPNGWFDGYEGQEAVIFDEFTGLFPRQLMLQLLDRYPLQLPIKGGFVAIKATKVVFTSNLDPSTWYNENFQRRLREFGTIIKY